MTLEEELEFKEKIKETIIPLAMNMTEDQIRSIINSVEVSNQNLPNGFGAMLFEQIMLYKYNNNRLAK